MLLFDGLQTSQARRHDHAAKGRYDIVLLAIVVALTSLGIIMVASSSIAISLDDGLGSFYYLRRQLMYLAGGLIVAGIIARVELRWVEQLHFVWLAAGVLLLLLVFVPGVGLRINGAHRWLNLGPLSFQPVEAMKLILIVYVASYLVRHRDSVQTQFWGALKPLLVAIVVAVILLAQPDFGSAVLLMGTTVGLLWLGGTRMRNLIYMGLPLIPVAIFVATSEDYRMKRLTSFLNPWNDPFDDGFQLVQALIAIGRGEWFGVGLGGSVQKLFYLPEANSDFILAVIGEELGFVGIVLVIGLFAALVWRGMSFGLKGLRLNQHFAAFVTFGISLMIGLQAMISIGVNLGVLPTKGLTLPLISSGGSSILMTCAMIGMMLRCTYEINRAEDARRMAVRRFERARVQQPQETDDDGVAMEAAS